MYSTSVVLFEKLNLLAHGWPQEQVGDAALNVIINALRQAYPTADEAGRAWDELISGARYHLTNCYDTAGRKKIFVYHQVTRAA